MAAMVRKQGSSLHKDYSWMSIANIAPPMAELTSPKLNIHQDQIADFCRRWKISEFALFGSVLREDFGPHSDVDVLVTFALDARWGLSALYRMEQELKSILGREVDLVSRHGIETSRNYLRRKAIVSSARVIHVAR